MALPLNKCFVDTPSSAMKLTSHSLQETVRPRPPIYHPLLELLRVTNGQEERKAIAEFIGKDLERFGCLMKMIWAWSTVHDNVQSCLVYARTFLGIVRWTARSGDPSSKATQPLEGTELDSEKDPK